MGETFIHILVTAVAIPIVLYLFQRFVSKSDAEKEKSEALWRSQVTTKFDDITKKITSYCADNYRDHEQLYNSKNDLFSRVGAIETIHHQRGCDQPFMRREIDRS